MSDGRDAVLAIGLGIAAGVAAILIIKMLDDMARANERITAERISQRITEGRYERTL